MLKRKHLLLAATIVPIIIGLFVFAFYLCLSDTANAAGGNGLFARYFTTRNLSKQAFTRVDATVNFDWGSGSPGAGVSSDNFSVRWEGQVEALYSEQYTFYTTSDDGVRLWVNNNLLVDNWTNHASTDNSGSLKLTARQKYNIRLEYYENKGNANIKLGWSSPSQPRQVIPASQLFPTVSTTPGNTPTATPIPTSTPVRTTTTVPTTTAIPTTTVGIPTATPTTVPVPTGIWKPALNTTWQWQLDGTLNTTLSPLMYDIDLFDSTAADVQKLHAANHKAVCYISTGSWEDWRPDAALFPSQVLGRNYDGWPGERWLDIRQIDQLAPIMQKRLDLCKSKGFDGVEPDNIDAYTNNTGFPLTAQDQLKYNSWLANEAHARGLAIGLKNDNDQVKELLPYFDFAILEDCFDQGWCADFSPFVQAGKAVFAAEYTDTGMTLDKFCSKAKTLNFNAILKNRGLDAWLLSCN